MCKHAARAYIILLFIFNELLSIKVPDIHGKDSLRSSSISVIDKFYKLYIDLFLNKFN